MEIRPLGKESTTVFKKEEMKVPKKYKHITEYS